MSPERKKIVLIQEEERFLPLLLNRTSGDPLALTVSRAVEKLSERVGILTEKLHHISRKTIHGRPRSLREIRDVERSLEWQIGQARTVLSAFESESIIPIRIAQEESQEPDVRLTSFSTYAEATWWKRTGEELSRVAIEERYPEVVIFFVEYYRIRDTLANSVDSGEVERAKQDMMSFEKKLDALPEEQQYLMGGVLRRVTDRFGRPKS